MLRQHFQKPKRRDEGLLAAALKSVDEFSSQLQLRMHKLSEQSARNRVYRLLLWATGLKSALDELEQSLYCAGQYRIHVKHTLVEDMDEVESEHYSRHLYYYKNAVIRLFSLLDKLGAFTNDILDLQTEQMKDRFSYFTVMRRMRGHEQHGALEKQLYDLRSRVGDALQRLRELRNQEIHYLNLELLDELVTKERTANIMLKVENLDSNMRELNEGFEMACRSLCIIMEYCRLKLKDVSLGQE